MDASIGLVRGLVPVTLALHVRIPGSHPSVATLGDERTTIEVVSTDRAEFYA
jgi:hypothetical protein